MNKTLMTDFYEIAMAQTYFDQGKKDEIVYFDIFFRKNPFNGGYTISGGLDEIIDYVKNFHFDEEDINYLRSIYSFKEEFEDLQSKLIELKSVKPHKVGIEIRFCLDETTLKLQKKLKDKKKK